MNVREIRVEIFESYNFVFWDCTPKQIETYIKKHLRGIPADMAEYIGKDESSQGCCWHDGANCIIWLSDSPKKRPDLIAHEAVHAAQNILDHWSIDSRNDGAEVSAAIVAHIVKRTLSEKRNALQK